MSRMPSVMSHDFSRVPHVDIPRSVFNRSCGNKLTFDAGYLVPCFVDEVLPGDTFNLNMAGFARLATPLHPFMDNLHMETFFFFVPNRLLWDNWQEFNGEQRDPDDSTDFLVPTLTSGAGGFGSGSVSDYFAIPTGVPSLTVNALHHRAYNLIYQEWFRDENLQDAVPINRGDGPDDPADYPLRRRGKRHDYFTSCLPWPQKGDSVNLPLGDFAPVEYQFNGNSSKIRDPSTGDLISVQGDLQVNTGGIFQRADGAELTLDPDGTLFTDLQNATASTVNELRQAFQIQKLYEKDARGGTRYTEILKSHFGVTSPDARLQRPEYLGGGYSPIQVNPIAQTSATDQATTPQGNLAAVGTSGFKSHGFTSSFTEHGVIIGLVCVRADLTYQQGLNRMWSRQTRYDFYWPTLAHLGEQAVLSKEIYADGTPDDELVFGYQERYAEMRYKPSTICGKFRSNDPQSLDAWHLSQDFENRPVLDSQFIQETPPVQRVLAVQDEPQFIMDTFTNLKCTRPMPTYSVPGLIDHF